MPEFRYDLHREIEDRHWWFLARRKIILDVLSRYLPPDQGLTVVEVGCGTGGNLVQLKRHYRAIGTEISTYAAETARKKTGCPVYLGSSPGVLGDMLRGVDGMLLLDLLEHLPDPVELLKDINRSTAGGTILFVTVPAGQWFFSEHDVAFGHLRRYSRGLLQRQLEEAGFTTMYASHFNTLLYGPSVIIRLVRKLILPIRRGKRYKTDFWIPPQPFNGALAALMGLERFFLGRASLPFGLSLIAVAGKKK